MIQRLVILGMGDVTTRFVLPALGQLLGAKALTGEWNVIVVSREHGDADDLRAAIDDLDDAVDSIRPELAHRVSHHVGDATSAEDLESVLGGAGPVAVYLALPPTVFQAAIEALFEAGLPEGSRVVIEKPFGTDLESAVALDELLHRELAEHQVFRIDHFLGEQTVYNVLGARFANRVLEPAWTAEHIAAVEITWDETLAMEGRAGSYDSIGAARDMLQNHLLQLMCLVAMEPPESFDPDALSDRKVEVLRATGPFGARSSGSGRQPTLSNSAVRGRYSAGQIDGSEIPAYVDTDGVDPERGTETFASMTLEVNTPRWNGVPFTLRSGKALHRDRHEILIRFRDCTLMNAVNKANAPANELRFNVSPDTVRIAMNMTALNLTGDRAERFGLTAVELCHDVAEQSVGPYAQVMREVLHGGRAFSVRDDEVEAAWKVVTPFLEAFADDEIPLLEYPAGSHGPASPSAP
jgi:glucose-6-phosphate 1-dehydrogenase